jgi:nucleoside-diphosphate-sugar epimerase
MPSLVILGASGFLGSALVAEGHFSVPIKAVVRDISREGKSLPQGVTRLQADLHKASSLDDVLCSGDVVCNLAYARDAGETVNLQMIDNIIEACFRSQVSRLVHCSTAVVVGAAPELQILESTACMPQTPYEKTKWMMEQRVLSALPRGLDVGILRPTAIVGPGGQNLLKLAIALQHGNGVVNYLRASAFGRRFMHLVPVRNVTAALLHMLGMSDTLNGNIYHVSSDNDPNNNFERVEEVLLLSLGLPARRLPLLPLPPEVLSLLLGLKGRPAMEIERIYDPGKLLETGFTPVDTVINAVREFGAAIRTHKSVNNGTSDFASPSQWEQ